jgi:predicted RND superfamily exporter protein
MINLKTLAWIQTGVVVLTALILYFVHRPDVYPFLCGAALISVNFVLLGQVWRGVLEKKSVAMTMSLVVIKYAILVIVLYIFVKEWHLPMLPLFVGLATMAASFLLSTVLIK